MAFNWNSTPNPPTPIVPIPVPPGEVTYEVKLVANTVDYGGTVRYNTANHSYDVIYEFPTLNVTNGVFENGFFESANIGNATINVAAINHASINTANITNASITFGYVTGSPNANMGIASKFYVDNAVASISGGSGPDTTANLFVAKGDLLVGISPNTAVRFPVGADGLSLIANPAQTLKLNWAAFSSSQKVDGLLIGTHHHPTLKFSQVLLTHAETIIMDDGTPVPDWNNLVADITVSGAGGLDSNSAEAANTWYEVWAIRNSSTGAKALLLHRMKNHALDQSWDATLSGQESSTLGSVNPNMTNGDQRYVTKVSQSIVAHDTGPMRYIELKIIKSTPRPSNLYMTLETDDGFGNASGTVLATSRSISDDAWGGQVTVTRFVFDTAATVTNGSKYLMVCNYDGPTDNLSLSWNGYQVQGNIRTLGPGQQRWMANVGYNNPGFGYHPYDLDLGTITLGYGDARQYNVALGTWKLLANTTGFSGPSDFFFRTYIEHNNTALVLPTGYNQKCLLSYVHNNTSSNFKEYHQHNRYMVMGYDPDWFVFTVPSTGVLALDIQNFVPPIFCHAYFMVQAEQNFGANMGSSSMMDISREVGVNDYLMTLGSFPHGSGCWIYGPAVPVEGSQVVNIASLIIGSVVYLTGIHF